MFERTTNRSKASKTSKCRDAYAKIEFGFLPTEKVLQRRQRSRLFVSEGATGKTAAVIPVFKVWQTSEEEPIGCGKPNRFLAFRPRSRVPL